MRYFFSTGEASGELNATLLAAAIREYDDQAAFEGIGHERMREAGFKLWRDHTGWASMGPLAAIPRIPPLLATMWRTALHIDASKPDLVVLVDFGAFNMRLAKALRQRLNYRGPLMYLFPPATWLDKEGVARAVAAMTVPVTAFKHQYDFYKRHRLPIMFFGHPLQQQYVPRPRRPAAPPDGGVIALLPGSRGTELKYHVPAMLDALRELRKTRPRLQATFSAANADAEKLIRRALRGAKLDGITIVRGVRPALENADGAFVASGTAVLEAALIGVPSVAVYIVTPLLAGYGRRLQSRIHLARFITLPNLVLGREVVPELLQEDATSQNLAQEMESILRDPSQQYAAFDEVREALGPQTALGDCAKFSVALAKAGAR